MLSIVTTTGPANVLYPHIAGCADSVLVSYTSRILFNPVKASSLRAGQHHPFQAQAGPGESPCGSAPVA